MKLFLFTLFGALPAALFFAYWADSFEAGGFMAIVLTLWIVMKEGK